MDLQIRGNVAVMTGGPSGMGWACAKAFAQEGCAVPLISATAMHFELLWNKRNPFLALYPT